MNDPTISPALIRLATCDDARTIAGIQVASWREAYRGILPAAHLASLDVGRRQEVWSKLCGAADSRVFVVSTGPAIAGFCHLSDSRDENADGVAEITSIYLDPGTWRRGLGRRLMSAAVDCATRKGKRAITLWVIEENLAARRFYEAIGFVADGATKQEFRQGFTLQEIRYRLDLPEREPVTIRSWQATDAEAIWQVYFLTTHESNGRDYHPELLERWAPRNHDMAAWSERLGNTNPFVAIVDEKIVGMAEIDSSGVIDYFYVLPRFQGRGIGRMLLDTLEFVAQTTGCGEIQADVSITARPFFEANGFRVTEARANIILGHPAPNFAMVKPLPRG